MREGGRERGREGERDGGREGEREGEREGGGKRKWNCNREGKEIERGGKGEARTMKLSVVTKTQLLTPSQEQETSQGNSPSVKPCLCGNHSFTTLIYQETTLLTFTLTHTHTHTLSPCHNILLYTNTYLTTESKSHKQNAHGT